MKKILYLTLILGTMIITSCKKDSVESIAEQGAISLSYGIAVSNDSEIVSTRAMSNDDLLNTAVIEIYKPLYEGLARRYVGQSNIPNPIYLPATEGASNEDKYRVEVRAGEVVKETPAIASWDQPSYRGSTLFSVTAGNTATTEVKVTANISNAITKVTFGDGIATGESAFSNYKFTIADENGNTLEYTSAKNEALGYFIIADDAFEPELSWIFSGTLTNGDEFSRSGKFIAAQSKQYNIALTYTERNGDLSFTLNVDNTLTDIYSDIIFEPTATGLETTKSYETWASHTTLHAVVDVTEYDPEAVYFEYTLGDEATADWTNATRVKATGNKDENGVYDSTFDAVITGLNANQSYTYRLVITKLADGSTEEIVDGVKTITTDEAPTIPNASFEDYSNADSDKYPSFYNPSSTIVANQTQWWDSGNAGSGDYNFVICAVDEDDKKDGNASARLQSAYAVVKFAAGNLFTGKFGQVIGTKGGTVYFGRPFEGRPSKIRFWVKYSTAKVNRTEGVKITKDEYDIGQIRVALGTWDPSKYGGTADSPVLVNTTDQSTFVDFNTDAATIAYGDLQITTDGTNYSANINGTTDSSKNWNEWQQVTLDLEYHDLKTIPTHIIISCAASKYGDYFEGCEESKMWVDNFELIYDHNVVTK